MNFEATNQTLIERIKDKQDEHSWEEFTTWYLPYITAILKKSSLAEAEIDDVAQNILLKVWKGIGDFEYDPDRCRFRSWLMTVCKSAVATYFRASRHRQNSLHMNLPETQEEQMSESEIDRIVEDEWKVYIYRLAYERVSKKTSSRLMSVFDDYNKKISVKELMEKYELKESSIYTYNKRVKDALTREMILLLNDLE